MSGIDLDAFANTEYPFLPGFERPCAICGADLPFGRHHLVILCEPCATRYRLVKPDEMPVMRVSYRGSADAFDLWFEDAPEGRITLIGPEFADLALAASPKFDRWVLRSLGALGALAPEVAGYDPASVAREAVE